MTRGIVAIVGRPNVGKSSLFNRLAGDKLAITDDMSGVTRDRLYSKCEWLDQEFNLIDTGGIQIENVPFMEEIKAQVQLAIDEADVIIFVVDGRCGKTNDDDYVMNFLRKSKKPVIVAANKIDDVKFMDNVYEFYNFGVEDVIPVSCLHGNGVGDLLDKVITLLPKKENKEYNGTLEFCLIGQPNVGKSSLTNAILGTDRVIVSEIEGTTRDAIDTPFTRDGENYVVIDTAGIRKQGKMYENAEKYSYLRALKAIERSQVVLFLIDATKSLEEQDERIAGLARDNNKASIIVVNKWDAVVKNDKTMKEFEEKIRKQFVFLTYAPIVFVSALKNERIHTLFEQINIVYENFNRRLPTNVVNDIILDANIINPAPEIKGQRLRIYYASQVSVAPPTFVMFCNAPDSVHFSYQRFLENKLRESFNLEGCPIKIIFRRKEE